MEGDAKKLLLRALAMLNKEPYIFFLYTFFKKCTISVIIAAKKNIISNTSRLPLVSLTDKEKKIHNFNIHGTFPLEKVFFKEEKKYS